MNNKDGDQVEQLLQAAQDELILKLSVDSHMSHVSPDHLPSDLDRRFQALKSRPSSIRTANQSSTSTNRQLPPDADDLLARFAALKASTSSTKDSDVTGIGRECGGDSDEEEDEVGKIIQWAKDAARLDPSPPSDDDDVIDDDDDSTDGEDEDTSRVDKTKRYQP